MLTRPALAGVRQQLYDIEARAKRMSEEERLVLRQQEAARPCGNPCGRDWTARLLPKSKLGDLMRSGPDTARNLQPALRAEVASTSCSEKLSSAAAVKSTDRSSGLLQSN